jgi:hypothetical protein
VVIFSVIGRVGAFELETPLASAAEQQQVQLRSTLCRVKIGIALPMGDPCLLEGEAFPIRSVGWMYW